MSAAAPCGAPTESGEPCRLQPLAGRDGGRCYRHAGLAPTEAQREASRGNPVKHGFFVRGLVDEQERAMFAQVMSGEVDPSRLRMEMTAAMAVRAARVLEWELREGKVSPQGDRAFAELRQLLATLPAAGDEKEDAVDHAELVRQVEAVLAEDPELFLRRLPPALQETLRRAMREAGALPTGGT